ncbi:hypothetical protein K8I61_09750, partial [bacterium]|nr:hypothetical protein [bacterium]
MIARIVPSARVVAHATAAVLIFGVLTVLVGLAAARFYGNAPVVTTADSKRASSETAPRLPAAWADPAQRGRVEALIAAGGHLFAAGPGLGVYRSTDESAWRPFHRGLETDMDILALALTPDGLFAGSRSGRLYRFADDAWRLVATFGDGPIRAICFFGAGYVVADEANIWTMKADARPERTPRGDAPWYFLTDRKVRTAREPTGLWTRAGEGAFVSGLTGETITAIGGAPGASACAVPGSPDDTGAALW